MRTQATATKTDNIKSLFGPEVARELIEINVDDTKFQFKMNALVTSPNYQGKRMTLLLFINNRLVESNCELILHRIWSLLRFTDIELTIFVFYSYQEGIGVFVRVLLAKKDPSLVLHFFGDQPKHCGRQRESNEARSEIPP